MASAGVDVKQHHTIYCVCEDPSHGFIRFGKYNDDTDWVLLDVQLGQPDGFVERLRNAWRAITGRPMYTSMELYPEQFGGLQEWMKKWTNE